MPLTRREFLLRSFGSLGAAALAMERLGTTEALAQSSDYKALVCILLAGGNDSDNMIIPVDNYAEYAAVRDGAGMLQIPHSSLLPMSPPSAGGQFGLHPGLAGVHTLWQERKLAIVCNVGPLAEPTTRDSYRNGAARRPLNLFSHSDQQTHWQTSVADGIVGTGWGGRMADRIFDQYPDQTAFPLEVTLTGTTIFTAGAKQRPLSLPAAPTRLDSALRLDGFSNPPANDARYKAMRRLLDLNSQATLLQSANDLTRKAVDFEAMLRLLPEPIMPFPLNPRTTLGNQLEQVAKLISLRNLLGMKRQLFFCSIGGFDTHSGQVGTNPTTGTHASLLSQLSGALERFYQATEVMGVASQVVTFTISDFGRTFKPNGAAGSDHGWGGHQLVMGGSILGGDFYGMPGPNGTVFPTLAPNGPDDADEGSGARGRWIPTTAVDQYAATLVTWFGVRNADMPAVLPNLSRFGTSDLGLLGP